MDVLSGDTRREVDAGFRALPDPAPLPMPEQPLHAGRHRRAKPSSAFALAGGEGRQPSSPPALAGGEGRVRGAIQAPPGVLPSSPAWIGLRRFLVLGGAVAMTAGAAYEMYRVLAGSGLTALGAAMVLLFILLFGWIALACTSALAGFCSVLAGGGCRLGTGLDAPLPALSSRTALLMPVYNEQPARVMAALQAIDESLAHLRASEWFDIFVLSDTTEPDIWIEEEAAFLALRDRIGAHWRLFYRRRPHNTARKPGNIAEWVGRFGDAYPQFLILDADSLMTGEALVRLAGAMQRHADVGLIQTLPVIVGGATLLARLQQFAGRVYGPVIAHGIAWWHGAEGNYWGHNAMVRTQAFAACAGLPVLAGRRPFGGPIMSHDFVEAGLLRRGGWAVQMVPGLAGSYEASPPSLIDLAIRDRRWCQGNLQHAAVLPARGLHWISRLHLLTGIGSYVTAPLWLLFLLIGLLIAVQSHFVPFDYFPGGRTLFPRWPQVDPVRARWLFEVAMVVLLAPKVLGLLAALLRGPDRRGCGGAARLIAGAMIETVLAGLIAPVAMLTQTIDVLTILGGRESGWNPQRRDDGRVPPRDILRRYLPHTLLGVMLSLAAFWASPFLALWMLPVSAGLVLAIPLAAITGARTAGAALRRTGLLGTPEERAPPGVLLRASELSRAAQQATSGGGIRRLLSQPALLDAHLRMLPPARRRREGPIPVALLVARAKLDEADTLDEALRELTRTEAAAVLSDPDALMELVEIGRSDHSPHPAPQRHGD